MPTPKQLQTRIKVLERENAGLHELLGDNLRELRQFAIDRALSNIATDDVNQAADAIVDYVWPGAREAAKK